VVCSASSTVAGHPFVFLPPPRSRSAAGLCQPSGLIGVPRGFVLDHDLCDDVVSTIPRIRCRTPRLRASPSLHCGVLPRRPGKHRASRFHRSTVAYCPVVQISTERPDHRLQYPRRVSERLPEESMASSDKSGKPQSENALRSWSLHLLGHNFLWTEVERKLTERKEKWHNFLGQARAPSDL
jgi:hypothetical protein